ncbi:DUF4384 domain-containing protein [Benzoatithermus flavus]|uniref:DUF4384 domain-containing protein n=1 Tax=Benzoatithermus flavus TaxID=3108223 RepID=A0ABU8XT81_9PROT
MAGVRSRLRIGSAVLVIASAPAAAAGDAMPAAVVLASTAPGYTTGQTLAEAMVEVPDGASTTFLLPGGQAITIKGPYKGSLTAQKPAGRRSALAQLLAPGQDRSQIGGTRSLEQGEAGSRLVLDPAGGGRFCATPETEIALARPADPAFNTIEIRKGGHAATVRWEADRTIPWPQDLPLADGTVTVRSVRTGEERQLELRMLAGAKQSDAALAATLALAGCSRQAETALERLRDATVPLDLYLASDHGRYPVYRPGEPVRLVIQTNRDAYLYCMARDTQGQVLPLFPREPGQTRVASRGALSLPVSVSADESEIRCIASERNLAADLPQLARSTSAGPLSEETMAALDRAIADPRQGRIVVAQLVLRVQD